MNRKLKVKAGRGWDVRLADAYAYTSAAVCAAMGLLMLYGTLGEGPRMRQLLASPDAVLGMSNHTLLIVAGVIHLALGAFLIVKRDPASCGAVTAWAGFNYLVYHIGVAWMGVAAPLPGVRAVAQNAGIAPATLNVAWWCVTLFFLTGTCVILAGACRRWRQAKSIAVLERWREYRETASLREATTRMERSAPVKKVATGSAEAGSGHVPPTNESMKGEFKFTCPSCGQHIQCEIAYASRFPAHALGRKISCPHCKMDITLKEPV